MQGRDTRVRDVVDHVPVLLPERRGHGEHPLDEPTAVRTVGAEAALPPQHRRPECAFGRVVGRLDAGHVDERPEGRGAARGCPDRWPPSCGAHRPPHAAATAQPVGGAAALVAVWNCARERVPSRTRCQAANIACVCGQEGPPDPIGPSPRAR